MMEIEKKKNIHPVYQVFKRILDLFFSFISIIVFLPFFIVLVVINAFITKGHPLFIQDRSGRNNKPFKIIKFRTMRLSVPNNVPTEELEENEGMYFRFGYILKKSHLDEFPQVWNILLGQMSFVGPRPGLTTQYDLIEYRTENGSISLRPGLTGLAQMAVDNHGPLTQKEKSVKDKEYMDNMSFGLDTKILFKTLSKVFGNLKTRKKNKNN